MNTTASDAVYPVVASLQAAQQRVGDAVAQVQRVAADVDAARESDAELIARLSADPSGEAAATPSAVSPAPLLPLQRLRKRMLDFEAGWLASLFDRGDVAPPPGPVVLPQMERAIEWALAEWERVVVDRYDHPRILEYYRLAGWAWWVSDGYRNGDPRYPWCGIFVMAALTVAGVRPEAIFEHASSTRRMDGQRGKAGPGGALGWLARAVPVETVQRGDIATVGDGDPACGDHIVLVERVEGGTVYTVEGNGVGRMPDGGEREGVVRDSYPLDPAQAGPGAYTLRRCYRLRAEDFKEAA